MEQTAIAIIGGADGPTAIFLAGPGDGTLLAACGLLALIAAGIWLYGRRKRHRKKK